MRQTHLRVIPGGNANFVTHAEPREWSQSPDNVRMVEAFAAKHCADCKIVRDRAEVIIWYLLLLLLTSNGVWFVMYLVRKGIID